MRKTLLTVMLLAFTMIAGATGTKSLSFTSEDFSYHWVDGEDGDPSYWYFGCSDDSGYYLLRLAYNTESQTGTIKYSDLNTEYSYLNYQDYEEEVYNDIYFAEGTELTISEDELYVYITGNLVGEDETTYVIDAKCPKPQPKTYDIEGATLTQAEYDDYFQQWDVRFRDADYNWKINLSVKSEDGNFAGTYTIDDDADGCYAEDLNEDENHAFTSMEVTFALPDGNTDPAEGCEITGWGKDAEGNTYNFHMKKDAPIQPKEVKNIMVDVATAEWPSDRTGGSYYELTETDNPDNKWILSLTEKAGECTSKQFGGIDTTATYRVNTATEEELRMNNGTITQTFDMDNLEISVDVALVMNDSIQYNFSFTTPVSMEGEQTLTFTDLQVDKSYSEWGSTTLNASNDSIQFSCELTDYAEIPAEYNDMNCRIGLNLYQEGEEYSTYVSSNALIYANTTVDDNNNTTFKAKFLGDDKVVYTIEASYIQPAIEDTLHLTFEESEMGDNTQYGEGFYFMNTTDSMFVWVRIESDNIEGHYTIADINNNSRIEILNKYGMNKQYYLSQADFTVTKDGIKYTLDGTCQAGPHFVYLTMNYTMQGLDYDNYEEDVDVTFDDDDIVEITPTEDEYGYRYVYVQLHNAERNDELCLVLFPEEFTTEPTIPAGNYEITSWGWGNYVQSGQPSEEGIYPSYYAKLDDNGYVKAPLWFIYSGSMDVQAVEGVENAFEFEINALNSYNRTVHVVFTSTQTGIQDIQSNSNADGICKFLKDGKIVIRHNGIEYTVSGQRR